MAGSKQVSGRTPKSSAAQESAASPGDGRVEGQSRSLAGSQQKLREILNRILTGEVIPRVFEANGGAAELKTHVDRDTIDAFRSHVLEGPHELCTQFVQERIDGGMSLRNMCLGLFTITAQELGELWSDDQLSFAEVTIGLGRLHKLVHHFSSMDSSLETPGARHNIILASAPAEQHAFGVLLVSKIFEMEGWLVTGGPDLHTGDDLTSLISESWFDIIGLSASSEELAQTLKEDIEALRAASLNPDVYVMVGGNGFGKSVEMALRVGADGMASDADDAIIKARALLLRRAAKARS